MLMYVQMIETPVERSKFEEIYLSYRELMYQVAFRRLNNPQDAEDAVHHAFVKIAEHIQRIEPISPKTKQLAVTIVENRAIDILRARSRHPVTEFDEGLCAFWQEEPECDNLLARCINMLPDLQRQVIWLKYCHGYTLHEISSMLDISLSWAQKLDQRAKKKLEVLYQQEGGVLS